MIRILDRCAAGITRTRCMRSGFVVLQIQLSDCNMPTLDFTFFSIRLLSTPSTSPFLQKSSYLYKQFLQVNQAHCFRFKTRLSFFCIVSKSRPVPLLQDKFLCLLVYFLLLVLNLVVSASANDCMERSVSEMVMTYCRSSAENTAQSITHSLMPLQHLL